MLREQKGNMYPFVTHTWNPIKGRCRHACTYCYMKRWGEQAPLRLDEKELKTDLGEGNFIFVGSSTDMWARDVEWDWIKKVMKHISRYPKNTYLFQSKNPGPFLFYEAVPNAVWGTTIETNREAPRLSDAPLVENRARSIQALSLNGKRTMVTIEPIVAFDLDPLVELIKIAAPEWVNIGADSQGSGLPEPTAQEVGMLINKIAPFTDVKIKKNLHRLLEDTGG